MGRMNGQMIRILKHDRGPKFNYTTRMTYFPEFRRFSISFPGICKARGPVANRWNAVSTSTDQHSDSYFYNKPDPAPNVRWAQKHSNVTFCRKIRGRSAFLENFRPGLSRFETRPGHNGGISDPVISTSVRLPIPREPGFDLAHLGGPVRPFLLQWRIGICTKSGFEDGGQCPGALAARPFAELQVPPSA